jgi:uncharacterized protein (TIGR03083 family)
MTTAMTDEERQIRTEAGFVALADLLAAASGAQWDTPSLCAGWRIREVVAHLTMPARYSEEAFMAELSACDFDFGRLSDKIAARDAELSTPELVANLRSEILHRWTPPGGGQRGALNHVVVHGLDVTVPLGAPCVADDDTLRVVLDDLTLGAVHQQFGTVIDARYLEATDLAWSYGSGSVLRGPALEIVLALCGRTIPNAHLEGLPV